MIIHLHHRLRPVRLCAAIAVILALAGCSGADKSVSAPGTTPAAVSTDAATSVERTPVASSVDPPNTSSAVSSGGQGTSTEPICELLDGVDFATMIGEPVGTPALKSEGSNVCLVKATAPKSTSKVSLTLITSGAARRFAETEKMFGADSRAKGFGDDAFHSGPVLAVLDGERMYLLWVMGDINLGADIDDSKLEAVMTQILAAAG